MKIINLSKPLTDMGGEEVIYEVKGEEKKLYAKDVLSSIIATGYERPEQVDLARLFDLSNKVFEAGDELEVSSTQIEQINKCIKSNRWETKYTPYLVGQVLRLTGIEVADKKEKK